MGYSYLQGATPRHDQYEIPFGLNHEVGKYIVKQWRDLRLGNIL